MGGFWNTVAAVLGQNLMGASVAASGGPVGNLGDISFEVSSYNKIYTLDNFSREAKARLTTHEVIGSKPLVEFLGPDVMSVSFEIKLHTGWGVNPREEMKKLIEYCESGEVLTFVLGDKPVGENKWVIESISESVEIFATDGNILYSKANVSLKEYVENGDGTDADV